MSANPTYAEWARRLDPAHIVETCSPAHVRQTIEQARSAILTLQSERDDLLAECERLRAGYAEAIDDIADWGIYANEYFQQKHDLAGTIAKHRAAAGTTERPARPSILDQPEVGLIDGGNQE